MISEFFPTFSVVIPTRDRADALRACLEALAQQNYPTDRFEVIVVDDASRSPFPDAAAFADRLNLTVLRRDRSAGPGFARNCGAAHATGEFVAFTDDDCAPAIDWLKNLAARFASGRQHLIGGRVINALTQNPYSTAAHVILDVVYEYYDPEAGRPNFFPTSNFALATKQFREIGGFDEKWPLAAAEDREFCYRWLRRGLQMVYASEAKVYHHHALTLHSFCRLHFKYGRGAYHYHALRDRGSWQRGLKPDLPFYWACLRYPFRHLPARQAFAVTGLLLLWQLFNAIGYFWQRMPRRSREIS